MKWLVALAVILGGGFLVNQGGPLTILGAIVIVAGCAVGIFA